MLKQTIVINLGKHLEVCFKLSSSFFLSWTAKSLGHGISILAKNNNLDAAFDLVRKLESLKNEIFDQAP